MAELDDVMDKLEDVMEKLGEIEIKVNADSNYYDICAHCSGTPGGPENCLVCGGTGLILHGKMQKIKE